MIDLVLTTGALCATILVTPFLCHVCLLVPWTPPLGTHTHSHISRNPEPQPLKRQISESDFAAWFGKFQKAATAVEDRIEKIAAVSEEIEGGLTVVGATAIEDKLQVKEGLGWWGGVMGTLDALRGGAGQDPWDALCGGDGL